MEFFVFNPINNVVEIYPTALERDRAAQGIINLCLRNFAMSWGKGLYRIMAGVVTHVATPCGNGKFRLEKVGA